MTTRKWQINTGISLWMPKAILRNKTKQYIIKTLLLLLSKKKRIQQKEISVHQQDVLLLLILCSNYLVKFVFCTTCQPLLISYWLTLLLVRTAGVVLGMTSLWQESTEVSSPPGPKASHGQGLVVRIKWQNMWEALRDMSMGSDRQRLGLP